MRWLKYLAVLVFALLVVAIFLPGTLDSRKRNKMQLACSEMNNILNAESTYIQNHGGRYGTLEELVDSSLVKPEVSKGQVEGYIFSLTLKDNGFELHAVPADYKKSSFRSGKGAYSFYGDEKGVVYGEDKNGERATSADAEMICSDGRFGVMVRPKPRAEDNK